MIICVNIKWRNASSARARESVASRPGNRILVILHRRHKTRQDRCRKQRTTIHLTFSDSIRQIILLAVWMKPIDVEGGQLQQS